jgi:hypothetical protein
MATAARSVTILQLPFMISICEVAMFKGIRALQRYVATMALFAVALFALMQLGVAEAGPLKSLTCDPADYDLTIGAGLKTTAKVSTSGGVTTITPNRSGDTLDVADLAGYPGPTIMIFIPNTMNKGVLIRDQVTLYKNSSVTKLELRNDGNGGVVISGPLQLSSDSPTSSAQTAILKGLFIDAISCPIGGNSAVITGGNLVFSVGDLGMGNSSLPLGQVIMSYPNSINIAATNGKLCLNVFPYVTTISTPSYLYLNVLSVTISGNAALHLRQNGFVQASFQNLNTGNGSISTGSGADLCY